MAYAIITWSSAGMLGTVDEAEAVPKSEEQLAAEIDAALSSLKTIKFIPGVRLVDDDQPRWAEVMQAVYQVLLDNQGMQALVFMPRKGARAGGWVAAPPPAGALSRARDYMNQAGSRTRPWLRPLPTAGAPASWEDFAEEFE